MKLLLTSQGLLPKPPTQIKISFITTAAYGDYKNPTWLNVYRKQLRSYEIKKIEDLDLRNKNQKELEIILKDKDIVLEVGSGIV